jgi:hypothetical protein
MDVGHRLIERQIRDMGAAGEQQQRTRSRDPAIEKHVPVSALPQGLELLCARFEAS